MRKKYIKSLTLGTMLMTSATVMAQSNVIQGTVVDETGEPVIGATVRVEGSKTATVTDLDGNYRIEAPAGKQVVVSYIGYNDASSKGGRLQLASADTDLNEVVVVGYGTQKKAHLTGAISTVPMEDIQDLSGGNLASMLSGLVNGLSVDGGQARVGVAAQLYVRGTSTLSDVGSTAQQPLFVIDGYIYPNDVRGYNTSSNLGAEAFNNLDPSEVESITVLKDAAAAVYGARAANGVILVTTKKGKQGAPKISYSGQVGITDAVATPKMLSAYQYGRLYNAVKAAAPSSGAKNYAQEGGSLNHTTGLFQADELEAMRGLNYDLLDKYWSTGLTYKHSVNISGATDRVNYFANVGYFSQEGNLKRTEHNRWNFRAGLDAKVMRGLTAGLTVSGDYGKNNKQRVTVGGSNDENDYRILLYRPRYIPETVAGHYIAAGSTSGVDNYNAALMDQTGDYSNTSNTNFNIQGRLTYDFDWFKPLKGLKVDLTYSKSITNTKTNQYGSYFTIYSMNELYGSGGHLYTPVEGLDQSYLTDESNFSSSQVSNGNMLSRNMLRTDNYQLNFSISYQKQIGLHNISALFNIEKSEAETEYNYGSVTDPTGYTNYQSNTATGTQTVDFNRSESGTLGYIGRLNYSYADKYLFEFLLRSDASTKFAPENYWGTFYSFSGGWVISEENWFKDRVKWVDFLKVRASYGLTGRDNLTAWQWTQLYGIDQNNGVVFGNYSTNSSSILSITKDLASVNRNVHWDKDQKFNFGIDAQFLNRRLAVTYDTYHEWNTEMLMKRDQSVPSTVGTSSASTNFGEMEMWGHELSITWRDKIGKDFKYKVGINTSYSDNSVGVMDWENENYYRQIHEGERADVGLWGMQCLGMFRSYQEIEEYFAEYNITSYMGLTKDQVRPGMLIYKDVRGAQRTDENGNIYYEGPDGIVDADLDQVRLSKRSSNPYGFTVNLSAEWKGISLNAQLRASWGSRTMIPSMARTPYYGIESTNMPTFWNVDNMYVYEDVYDGSGNLVVKENREALYPNLAYTSINSVESSFWLVSGTRVTLNRLTLAYSLPQKWVKKVRLSNVRFNVTGQNLINFYNPYPNNFYSPLAGSYGSYPTLRTWTIGVNVGF